MGEFGLRLKRHYSIVAHSPDLVELRHGVWNPESYTFRDDALVLSFMPHMHLRGVSARTVRGGLPRRAPRNAALRAGL